MVASIQLIPNNKALLDELRLSQIVKIFPCFIKPKFFRTVFKTAHHLYLSPARSLQSTLSHHIYLKSTLVLSSHLRLGLPAVFCPPILLRAFISSTVCAIRIAQHFLLDLITRVLFDEEHKS
jgi:hypothetical protein